MALAALAGHVGPWQVEGCLAPPSQALDGRAQKQLFSYAGESL
jgi:hypothetical protein